MVDRAIVNAYSTSQYGGDLPYFVGRQYGSGWLRTLARFAFPILKRVGRVAVKTAQDVIEGDKKILPSLYENTISEVNDAVRGNGHVTTTTSSNPKKRKLTRQGGYPAKRQKHATGSGMILAQL